MEIRKFTSQEDILGGDNDNAEFRTDLNAGLKRCEESIRSIQE
jgi:hypothetical protein